MMKAFVEVVKFNVNDIVTTSVVVCGVENNAGSEDFDLN